MALYNANWDAITATDNALQKKLEYAVLKLCSVIRKEPSNTANHAARLDWAAKFWPVGSNPLSSIPSNIWQLYDAAMTNADVIYAIGVGGTALADLGDAVIDTIVNSTCPSAA